MTTKQEIELWIKENETLLSNGDISLLQENKFNLDIQVIKALYKLYKDNELESAFCSVCGNLCKLKSNYIFRDSCSVQCGQKIRIDKVKINYNNKTKEEKDLIKLKRKETNLSRYGAETNLQTQTVKDKRIKKYGSNTPFASKEIRDQIKENNRKNHDGLENPFQWKTSKEKAKQTKLEKYGDPEYRNMEKIKQTTQNHYGIDSYMKTQEFRDKTKEKCLNLYGVDSYMKVPEVIEKLKSKNRSKYNRDWYMGSDEFKDKSKNWCLNTYGVEYNCMRKDVRDKSKAKSKVNKKWKEFLNITEEEFSIDSFSYDLKKDNILIEINPTITHNSTLSIFSDDKPKDKLYHKNKSKLASQNGYRCIMVWDWDDPNKIKDILIGKEILYAKNLIVKEVNKKDCDIFLHNYHIQNSCNNQQIRLGLFTKDNELIEIMTFGKPRYNKNYEYELLRLCTKNNKKVVGGSEKLFKHFIKNYKPKSIISYCDMSKFTGEVYLKLGFILKKEGNPSKHWYNKKTNQHFTDNLVRQQGVNRLLNMKLDKGISNEQIMIDNGFLEIYDCGQNTYIWETIINEKK